jgi:hypothetical protein
MAFFSVHKNRNGDRGLSGSVDDKALVAMCIAVIVGVLALSGVLSGENVKDILPALLK